MRTSDTGIQLRSGSLAKNRADATACFPTQTDFERAFADPKLLARCGKDRAGFKLLSPDDFITIGSAESLYSLLYQDRTRGNRAPIRAVSRRLIARAP